MYSANFKPQLTILAILLCLLSSGWKAQAQALEVGVIGGLSIYNGDFSPVNWEQYFEDLNPAFGVFGRYELNRTFAARLQATYTRLSADAGRNTTTPYQEGSAFRSSLAELSLKLEITPFRLYWFKNAEIQPFLTGGAAVYRFNPEIFLDGRWIEVQPLGTEGQGAPEQPPLYDRTQLSIPLGVGVRLNLNNRLSIGAEFTGYIVFTDYLDDLGSTVVMYDELRRLKGDEIARISNPFATEGENQRYRRGNPANDYYYIGGVTIFYRISDGLGRSGLNVRCYSF